MNDVTEAAPRSACAANSTAAPRWDSHAQLIALLEAEGLDRAVAEETAWTIRLWETAKGDLTKLYVAHEQLRASGVRPPEFPRVAQRWKRLRNGDMGEPGTRRAPQAAGADPLPARFAWAQTDAYMPPVEGSTPWPMPKAEEFLTLWHAHHARESVRADAVAQPVADMLLRRHHGFDAMGRTIRPEVATPAELARRLRSYLGAAVGAGLQFVGEPAEAPHAFRLARMAEFIARDPTAPRVMEPFTSRDPALQPYADRMVAAVNHAMEHGLGDSAAGDFGEMLIAEQRREFEVLAKALAAADHSGNVASARRRLSAAGFERWSDTADPVRMAHPRQMPRRSSPLQNWAR